MPRVAFEELPPSSRLWIFAADRPVTGGNADRLLGEADRFLHEWKAHGEPLRCGRLWLEDRFLLIAVDPSEANASGCSIDGLFRALQQLQRQIGVQLVGGGRVFYRGPNGAVQCVARPELLHVVARGTVTPDTPVFDTALTTLEDWRARFERPARDSWLAGLAKLS